MATTPRNLSRYIMITQAMGIASMSMLETSKSTMRGIDRKFPSRSELLSLTLIKI